MRVEEVVLQTEPEEFYVITERIERIASKVKRGFLILQNPSTTSFILLQENCEFLKEDLKRLFNKLAAKDDIYMHADNGHSHLLASVFNREIVIPVIDGKMVLGRWQEIIFYEADVKPRVRKINVLVVEFQ